MFPWNPNQNPAEKFALNKMIKIMLTPMAFFISITFRQ
jgi:hypothetical protein